MSKFGCTRCKAERTICKTVGKKVPSNSPRRDGEASLSAQANVITSRSRLALEDKSTSSPQDGQDKEEDQHTLEESKGSEYGSKYR